MKVYEKLKQLEMPFGAHAGRSLEFIDVHELAQWLRRPMIWMLPREVGQVIWWRVSSTDAWKVIVEPGETQEDLEWRVTHDLIGVYAGLVKSPETEWEVWASGLVNPTPALQAAEPVTWRRRGA